MLEPSKYRQADERSNLRGPGQTRSYKYSNFPITTNLPQRMERTPPPSPNITKDRAKANRFLRVVHPYQPKQPTSPSTVCLNLHGGEVILMHTIHTTGWVDGTALDSGQRGWVPINYCSVYEDEGIRPLLQAVVNLCNCIRDGVLQGHHSQVAAVVAAIRTFLKATGCISRESEIVKKNTSVRHERKCILSELKDLVTSARLCAQRNTSKPRLLSANDEILFRSQTIVCRATKLMDNLVKYGTGTSPPTPPFSDGRRISATSSAFSTNTEAALAPTSAESRLGAAYDIILSHIATFIGRLQTRHVSPGILDNVARETVLTATEMLDIAGLICEHYPYRAKDLYTCQKWLHKRGDALVRVAGEILNGHKMNVVDGILHPDEIDFLYARTMALFRATSDCHQAAKSILVQFGDFDLLDDSVGVRTPSDRASSVASNHSTSSSVMHHGSMQRSHRIHFDQSTDSEDDNLETSHARQDTLTQIESVSISGANESTTSGGGPVGRRDGSPDGERVAGRREFGFLSENEATPQPTPVQKFQSQRLEPMSSEPHGSSHLNNFTPSISHSAIGLPRILNESEDALCVLPMLPGRVKAMLPPLPKISPLMDESRTFNEVTNPFLGAQADRHLLAFSDEIPKELDGSDLAPDETDLEKETSTEKDDSYLSHESVATSLTTDDSMLVSARSSATSASSEANPGVQSIYLEPSNNQLELVRNVHGQVTGGTLVALVGKLLECDEFSEPLFAATFYLTFRCFTTPRDLAQHLITRYQCVDESISITTNTRLRVLNIFKVWFEVHWQQRRDYEAADLIRSFSNGILQSGGSGLLEVLERAVHLDSQLVQQRISHLDRSCVWLPSTKVAKTGHSRSNLSKSQMTLLTGTKSTTVLDFDAMDLARQFTIKGSKLFCAIQPEELVGQEFAKGPGQSLAVHVKAMSTLSNEFTNFVSESILQQEDHKRRALMLKQWLKIADRCLTLQNYDTLMSILAACSSSTIGRLKRTWDALSQKYKTIHTNLMKITDPQRNYSAYRQRLRDHSAPCLPFLGVYRTDVSHFFLLELIPS